MSDAYLTIIITGNPVDGLFFYGPFDNANEAGDWADKNHHDQDWWGAKLEQPEGYISSNSLHPEAQKLRDEDPWCEHAQYGRADWRNEVDANETSLGYFEWLSNRLEKDEKEKDGEGWVN